MSMEHVRPGDIILSFVKQRILAIGVAKSSAYDFSKPTEFGDSDGWTIEGLRVEVQYEEVERPLFIPDHAKEILELLPEKYSPLTSRGRGSQGYLFQISPIAAQFLMDRIGNSTQAVERAIESNSSLNKTVREALVQCRIGQGLFRESLLNYWRRSCAITGSTLVEILRASHIKPWRDSNNEERLDRFNGLLLAPTYDALFDEGLISFREDGESIQSPKLTSAEARTLGVNFPVRLRRIEDRHLDYLKYHRINCFDTERRRR